MNPPERTSLRTELKWLAIGLIPYFLIATAMLLPFVLLMLSMRGLTGGAIG